MSKCVFPFPVKGNLLVLLGSHLKRYISFGEMQSKTLDYILLMLNTIGIGKEEILITSGPEEELFNISHRFSQYEVKPLFEIVFDIIAKFDNNIHLIKKSDQMRLVTKLLLSEGATIEEINPHIILKNIRDKEAMGIRPEELEGKAKKPLDKLVAKIYMKYLEELKKEAMTDKRLLLLRGNELLNDPNIFFSLNKFKVIVVVSGQMLFETERSILDKFISSGARMIVLANDNLDIFGWKDMRFNDLVKLEENLGEHLLVKTTNFLAISDNSEVKFFFFEDEKKEAEYLCNMISNAVGSDIQYVIMCTGQQRSRYLTEVLADRKLLNEVNVSEEIKIESEETPIVLLKDIEEAKELQYPEGKMIYQSICGASIGKNSLKDGRE
ncbi:MAG: hypothetical protein DRP50_03160 [Thermotoga sp.]|nr:MAG: hypothetical protein DRP50_03160 [Thermotoga sp.]